MGCFEIFPRFGALGLLAGQLGFAETVFNGFQRNLHFVTDGQAALAAGIEELVTGDNTFGLQARMDGDPLVIYVDYNTRDDCTGLHIDGFQTLFK